MSHVMDLVLSDDDPEFTQDVIHMLTRELKIVKRKVRELQKQESEVAKLREENARLRKELEQLREDKVVETLELRTQLDIIWKDRDRLINLVERNFKVPYDSIVGNTQEQEQLLCEPYMKVSQHERSKPADTLTSGREQVTKKQPEEHSILHQSRTERDATITRTVKSLARRESDSKPFNLEIFVQQRVFDKPTPLDQTIEFYGPGEGKLVFPENVTHALQSPTPRAFQRSEYFQIGSAFLAIDPVLVYNPHSRGEGKDGFEPKKPNISRTVDLFCGRDNSWHFYGLYRRIGCVILSLHQLWEAVTPRDTLFELPDSVIKSLVARSVPSPEQVPQKVKDLIEELYTDGVLVAYCTAYERIGRNCEFTRRLESWLLQNQNPHLLKQEEQGKRKEQPDQDTIQISGSLGY